MCHTALHCDNLLQADIDIGKFLEHGEFRGNLYGTSVDGIRELVGAGYQPVLTPHYQVHFTGSHSDSCGKSL